MFDHNHVHKNYFPFTTASCDLQSALTAAHSPTADCPPLATCAQLLRCGLTLRPTSSNRAGGAPLPCLHLHRCPCTQGASLPCLHSSAPLRVALTGLRSASRRLSNTGRGQGPRGAAPLWPREGRRRCSAPGSLILASASWSPLGRAFTADGNLLSSWCARCTFHSEPQFLHREDQGASASAARFPTFCFS